MTRTILQQVLLQNVVRLQTKRVLTLFKEMEPDLIINSHQADTECEDFGNNLIRLKVTDQVKELQTVLRDRFDVKISLKKKMFHHDYDLWRSARVLVHLRSLFLGQNLSNNININIYKYI